MEEYTSRTNDTDADYAGQFSRLDDAAVKDYLLKIAKEEAATLSHCSNYKWGHFLSAT